MSLTDIRGRFLWYELLTRDTQGALEFYAKVAGWGLQPITDLGTPYTMFTRQGVPVAGAMQLPGDAAKTNAAPHWLAYVGVPDVDAMVAKAAKLGAKTCVAPEDIPTVGRFAVLNDPQGAEFALYRPLAEQPPSHPPDVGDFSWHELATPDLDGALRFYQQVAAWEQTGSHDMGAAGPYQMFGREGYTVGGMCRTPGEAAGPPAWLLYIRVADVLASVDAVNGNGGRVVRGPHEVPGGDWILVCEDPQGARFALHQRKSG